MQGVPAAPSSNLNHPRPAIFASPPPKDATVYEHSPRGEPWQAIFNFSAATADKNLHSRPLIRRSSRSAVSPPPSGANHAGWPRRTTRAAWAEAAGIVPPNPKAPQSSVPAVASPPLFPLSPVAIDRCTVEIAISPAKVAAATALTHGTSVYRVQLLPQRTRTPHLLRTSSTTPKRWRCLPSPLAYLER